MAVAAKFRLAEAAIVSGFTFFGILISAPLIESLFNLKTFAFIVASYLLIVSIYSFNSWGGIKDDVNNERLAKKGIATPAGYLITTLFTIALATLIFIIVKPSAVIYAVAVFILWGIYSFPKYGAKYVPVAGTLLHIVVGITQFNLGWLFFNEPSGKSFVISLFFALVLSGGHVNHELIDYDADRSAGISSGAVFFGKRNWTILQFSISITAFIISILITFSIMKEASGFIIFSIASLIHVIFNVKLMLTDGTQNDFLTNRKIYRTVFGLAGIIHLIITIF
jgi:4-hydroxybenzoate polyprenyltransferase